MSPLESWRREVAATLAMTAVLMFAALSTPVAQAQALPQARSQGSIEYVTGGVGKVAAPAVILSWMIWAMGPSSSAFSVKRVEARGVEPLS